MKELTIAVWGPAEGSIDWGDGSTTAISVEMEDMRGYTHGYAEDAIFNVAISGTITSIAVGSKGLTAVQSFGTLGAESYEFGGSINLTSVPDTLPSSVEYLYYMFQGCILFNDPNVSNWDTSRIRNFDATFDSSGFNQPLNWDTSNGLSFLRFLADNRVFNQPLTQLDFSSATDLSSFLAGARSFNHPIVVNAPNCTTVNSFFGDARAFNSSITFTNMTSCTDWGSFLWACDVFNQPLNNLDTSAGTDFSSFLAASVVFNQPLPIDVSSAVEMGYMLSDATALNQDLTGWSVPLIPSLPVSFADNTAMDPQNFPIWGT